MIFSHFDIFRLILFIVLFWFALLLFYFFYKKSININNSFWIKKIKNIYFLKYIFLLLSFFIILFSLFWPIYTKETKTDNDGWIPVVFALDVSKSMNVADINDKNNYYTRLDLAKLSIENFVLDNPGNSYWLVIFSWEAVSTTPITNDLNLFLDLLSSVDYKNLNIQWTDFEQAIIESNNRIKSWDYDTWAIILLSDGWDNVEIDKKNISNYYNDSYSYYFWWIWTDNWWKIILWKDVFWKYKYQMYNWDYVISKFNQTHLKNISKIFNWNYFRIKSFEDISIFWNKLSSIDKNIYKNNSYSSVSYNRVLSIISFLFFLLYIILYLSEKRIYLLINKND